MSRQDFDELAAHQVCRDCGKTLDSTTPLNCPPEPPAGSVSICAYCGSLAIFDDDSLLREPTDAELADWRASEDWALIERAVTLIKEKAAGGASR